MIAMDDMNYMNTAKETSAISLRDVHVAYGARTVLESIRLEIAQHQFVALLGANGAGKTTLMRVILGLLKPHSGSVQVLGKPAGSNNRDIGYVPQSRHLLQNARLRCRDFVACTLQGERWGLPLWGREARRQVDRALETVGATALAERPWMETSGGERQRLMLAQALLGEPRLLLLDEPLIHLDPGHQHQTIQLVKSLQQQLGITVLFSAHEINPLMGAVDQVLYLGSGQAALGSVDEVITSEVLSRLYGTAIDVLRHQNHIFVMAGASEVEKVEHHHDA